MSETETETRCPSPEATDGEHFWARYPVDDNGKRLTPKDMNKYGAFYATGSFCMHCQVAREQDKTAT